MLMLAVFVTALRLRLALEMEFEFLSPELMLFTMFMFFCHHERVADRVIAVSALAIGIAGADPRHCW